MGIHKIIYRELEEVVVYGMIMMVNNGGYTLAMNYPKRRREDFLLSGGR